MKKAETAPDERPLLSQLAKDREAQLLVKSEERVRNLGEVLTPAATVGAILDLLPEEMWQPHPSAAFFEPGCGDGNFLVEILKRKLEQIGSMHMQELLPAGSDLDALQFYALEALSSIYGVDICPENIVGGKRGAEIGSRQRLLNSLIDWYESVTGETPEGTSSFITSATWIVERNLLVGDMLKIDPRSPGNKSDVSLVEFEWEPAAFSVTLRRTSLAETMRNAAEETTGLLSLRLGGAETWTVHPLKLVDAPIASPRVPQRRVRNGDGWRAR